MIKDENIFDKYTTIWEKVSNIIKAKFDSELIYNKKYLKTEKRLNTKGSFQCFYMPVILLDYPKMFLEKFLYNFFWRNIIYNI